MPIAHRHCPALGQQIGAIRQRFAYRHNSCIVLSPRLWTNWLQPRRHRGSQGKRVNIFCSVDQSTNTRPYTRYYWHCELVVIIMHSHVLLNVEPCALLCVKLERINNFSSVSETVFLTIVLIQFV